MDQTSRPLQVLLVFSLILSASSEDSYIDGKFSRTSSGLTDVPDDIPEDAKEVYLNNNKIRVIRNNSFIHLEHCIVLELQYNDISEIQPDAFKGLVNLNTLWLWSNKLSEIKRSDFQHLENCTNLNLGHNKISNIQPGAFDKLINLRYLPIHDNLISKLSPDVFTGLRHLIYLSLQGNSLTQLEPEIFLNLPRPLNLHLGYTWPANKDNKFQCDSALCWLKQEKMDGTVSFKVSWTGALLKPKCAHGPNWDTFNCTIHGVCSEPGGIVHATRSGALYPYNVGSVVTYRCDSGYCGGGNITCQENGEWTDKQKCKVAVNECSPPSPLEHGTFEPSTGPFKCGSTMSYTCDSCPAGGGSIICQEDGTWTEDQPCTAMECTAPVPLEHGSFEPSTRPYKCGTAVTYSCYPGYKLYGSSSMMCTNPGVWNQSVRECIELNEQKVSSSSKEDGSLTVPKNNGKLNPILIGVESGIAGCLITAMVGGIIYLRKKQNRHKQPKDTGHSNPVFTGQTCKDLTDGNDYCKIKKEEKVHQPPPEYDRLATDYIYPLASHGSVPSVSEIVKEIQEDNISPMEQKINFSLC